MLYSVLVRDLEWMRTRALPAELKLMVRSIYPNPEGLSYVPWKPPVLSPPNKPSANKRGPGAATNNKKRKQK
jgi:hypothetical protein